MKRPNLIYIFADDMGYGDLSCLNENAQFKTENLDQLAAEGMRCTDAHSSSAVCTPSRYSVLTGRYNWRSTLKKGVTGGYSQPLLEDGRSTVASMLKEQGYKTACVGKWHLGLEWRLKDGGIASTYQDEEHVDFAAPITNGPINHGFDTYFGISASLDPNKSPLPAWGRDDWAALGDEQRQKESRRMEIYAEGAGAKQKSTALEDFGTVASYETVGAKWATVQNTPLRQWKNYSHEGGIRTPLVVNWPGHVKTPGGLSHAPGHLIDIMPTLVALTGAVYPERFKDEPIPPMQGVSLLPVLEDGVPTRQKPLFWQWSQGGAIRVGDMKAVFWGNGPKRKWELHDMSKTLNETNDLAEQMPERLATMKTQWQTWYETASNRKKK